MVHLEFGFQEFNSLGESELFVGENCFQLNDLFHVLLEVVLVIHALVELHDLFIVRDVTLLS